MPQQSQFLATALDAARAAAEVIRRYYQQNIDVTIKADKSPVTQADVESERVIRQIIAKQFPTHGFYGEETGQTALDAEYLWLVDPIDGTKAFVREYPFFSTQIALMHRGRLIVGVSSAPVYGELAYAQLSHDAADDRRQATGDSQSSDPTYSLQPTAYSQDSGSGSSPQPPALSPVVALNDRPIRVSQIDSIDACAISAGNLKTLARGPQWNRYGQLVARASRIRGYGDFLHYHLLAAGKIDVVIESDVNILDIAALAVIVEAAGGKFTDLDGNAVGLQTTTVLATNGKLHAEVLGELAP